MLPWKIFDKNFAIWCNLGRPKVCYYQPKREKNQQENLIAIFLSQINFDEHVSTKINTCRSYKGGWEASPPEAEELFKKSNKMEAFPYLFIFAFWQGSLYPQIY